MPLGGIVTLAILLPNILFLLLPPREAPAEHREKDSRFGKIEIIERIGQAGVFLIPFFYPLPALRETSVDALAVMVLVLLFYYSGWVRYATKGHRFLLLYAPFLGVPLPMAISPIVYFAAAAVFLGSWPLAAATVLLAAGHIPVSYAAWNRCRLVEAH
jgi:hypothetical protein